MEEYKEVKKMIKETIIEKIFEDSYTHNLVGDYVWTASQDNKVKRWTTYAVYYDEVILQESYVITIMEKYK